MVPERNPTRMALPTRRFGYLGAFLLVLTVLFVAVFGAPSLAGTSGARLVAFALAGALEVLGGFANPLQERVGAIRLVGAGHVLLAVAMLVAAAAEPSLAFRAVFVLSGLVVGGIGVDYLLGLGYAARPE